MADMNKIEFLKDFFDDMTKLYESFEWAAKNYPPPRIEGMDIYGATKALRDIGGDKLSWVGFKERYDIELREQTARQNHDKSFQTLQDFRNLRKTIEERIKSETSGSIDPFSITRIENQLEEDYQKAKGIHENMQLNNDRAGILLIDVMGHYDISGAAMKSIIHHLFFACAQYELKEHGEITPEVFENIDIRMTLTDAWSLNSSVLYGEISGKGVFRFISAGHPVPYVFSNKFDSFMPLQGIESSTLIGYPDLPKNFIDKNKYPKINAERGLYTINSLKLLGQGDLILLYTDGLTERMGPNEEFFAPKRLEEAVRANKNQSAEGIYHGIIKAADDYRTANDDTTLVVIKKI